MIYPLELTIPANTLSNNPVSRRDFIAPGVIDSYIWVMPDGCDDMVWLRLLIDETQIIPILSDTWLKGNGKIGPFRESIKLPPNGAHVQLIGCSPGTIYEHKPYMLLSIIDEGTTLVDVIAAISGGSTPEETKQAEQIASLGELPSNVFIKERR